MGEGVMSIYSDEGIMLIFRDEFVVVSSSAGIGCIRGVVNISWAILVVTIFTLGTWLYFDCVLGTWEFNWVSVICFDLIQIEIDLQLENEFSRLQAI